MTELRPYLQNTQPALISAADKVHQCFQPFGGDGQQYAMAVSNASADCRNQTNALWQGVQSYTGNLSGKSEAELVMRQNALVALNGERYYRSMVSSGNESWNIRDRHMAQTLQNLLEFHGPESKVIIWEHNTHVGDARYTDMAREEMVNVGQLAREQYGEKNVYIVGFGSYQGSVIAASSWGAPIQNMKVPKAIKGSWEEFLHRHGADNKIILSREIANHTTLQKSIGHRAIGVVYHPGREQGNYVPSIIPKRYDAFLYIDQTTALRPINTTTRNEPPDTYPSGY
jgi:erythromycin esterase-like protein